MLGLLVCLWRKEIKEIRPWAYKALICMLLIAIFCVLPRYRYNTGDRVRLIYQSEKGSPEYPPLAHYLVNVFFPEEELCNLGIWAARTGALSRNLHLFRGIVSSQSSPIIKAAYDKIIYSIIK